MQCYKVVAKKTFLKKMPPFCGRKKHLEKMATKLWQNFCFGTMCHKKNKDYEKGKYYQ